MRFQLRLLFTVAVIPVISGCVPWSRVATAKSPDGKKEVIVWEQKGFADSAVSITLRTQSGETTLFDDPAERVPKGIRIHWTYDSRFFLARVFDGAGQDLLFAYDTQLGRQIEESRMAEELKNDPSMLDLLRVP